MYKVLYMHYVAQRQDLTHYERGGAAPGHGDTVRKGPNRPWLRPVHLLRVRVSEGFTQASS